MELNLSLSPDKVGFYHKVISSTLGGFIQSERTNLIEKHPHLSTTNVGAFLVRVTGFEPAAS